jgi:hypothetical protein
MELLDTLIYKAMDHAFQVGESCGLASARIAILEKTISVAKGREQDKEETPTPS